MGFYLVILFFTGFYLVYSALYWVLLGVTGLYRVLPSFTGCYWVLLFFFSWCRRVDRPTRPALAIEVGGNAPFWPLHHLGIIKVAWHLW